MSSNKSWVYAKGDTYLKVNWQEGKCFIQETQDIYEATFSPILYLGDMDRLEAEGFKQVGVTISVVRTVDG